MWWDRWSSLSLLVSIIFCYIFAGEIFFCFALRQMVAIQWVVNTRNLHLILPLIGTMFQTRNAWHINLHARLWTVLVPVFRLCGCFHNVSDCCCQPSSGGGVFQARQCFGQLWPLAILITGLHTGTTILEKPRYRRFLHFVLIFAICLRIEQEIVLCQYQFCKPLLHSLGLECKFAREVWGTPRD